MRAMLAMLMIKVFPLVVLLLGCGGVSDYSDAELLADSERQIERSHHLYEVQRPNGGLIVSNNTKPLRGMHHATPFQVTVSPAAAVLLTGQLFAAVIYAPGRPNPTRNVLALHDSNGVIHRQAVLAQWREYGNIFAITAEKQHSHMYGELFFLRSALMHHDGVKSLGGYAQGATVQSHELSVAYSGRRSALAYSGKQKGMDMVISAELHQGRELINLNTLVVSPSGEVVHHLQSKDVKLHKLNDQFSRLYLPKLACNAGDLVLIRLAGHSYVHESNCYLIK